MIFLHVRFLGQLIVLIDLEAGWIAIRAVSVESNGPMPIAVPATPPDDLLAGSYSGPHHCELLDHTNAWQDEATVLNAIGCDIDDDSWHHADKQASTEYRDEDGDVSYGFRYFCYCLGPINSEKME